MVAIKALWGPFTTTPRQSGLEYRLGELRWYFFGIRQDGRMGRWSLVYECSKRKFRAQALEVRAQSGPIVRPNAWLDGSPHVWEGLLIDILKKHLTPEDIAMATAISLGIRTDAQAGRKR